MSVQKSLPVFRNANDEFQERERVSFICECGIKTGEGTLVYIDGRFHVSLDTGKLLTINYQPKDVLADSIEKVKNLVNS